MHTFGHPAQLDEIASPNGRLIQDVVPDLSDSDREFLMTGITNEQWDKAFGNED